MIEIHTFEDYLRNKHNLTKGSAKLQEISVKQYANRFDNMRREGIYKGEEQLTPELSIKIKNRYQDYTTYQRTIKYYIEFKKLSE